MKLTIVALIAAVLLIIVFYVQFDEELDPAVYRLLEEAAHAQENDAYYYLMGIWKKDAEPSRTGRQVVEQLRRKLVDKRPHTVLDSSDYFFPISEKLALPDGGLYCKLSADDCLERVFANFSEINAFLDKHAVILKRYETFLDFKDYRALLDERAVFHRYEYVWAGNYLTILTAIDSARQSNLEHAVGLLVGNIDKLRRHLAQAETVIGKMICAGAISLNLDVLAILLDTSAREISVKIAPLDKTELSLRLPASRHFAVTFLIAENMEKHPNLLSDEVKIPRWLAGAIYKPHEYVNAVASEVEVILAASELSPSEYQEFEEFGIRSKRAVPSRTNPIGAYLYQASSPSFLHKYLAVLRNLHDKIELFNLVSSGVAPISERAVLANSYFRANGFRFLGENEDGKRMCFESLPRNPEHFRCLRVSL